MGLVASVLDSAALDARPTGTAEDGRGWRVILLKHGT